MGDKNTASVDRVAATFEDGILELTVPKKSKAGPRQIPIVVAAASTTESLPNDHEEDEDDDIADEEEAIPPPREEEEEEIVFSESSEKVEEPHSTEEPQEEQEIEMTVVETVVNEDKAVTIEEDNKTHTTDVADNKSKEDDTWEEVLE